jgi:NhaP-type Na+/H+ or K+/H+ antiporter
MTAGTRAVAMLAAVFAGVATAALGQFSGIERSAGYALAVTALLGFGLYSSTTGIPLAEFRGQLRTVLLAVTVGVVIKAAIITGVMWLVFRDPGYLVLGIAVAQIDPLAVAALRDGSRMSQRAKALLVTWSAFDDPVTVLLTVYVTAFALRARDGLDVGNLVGSGLLSFALNLLWNVLLAGGVYLAWRAARSLNRHPGARPRGPLAWALLGLAVLVVAGIAVWFGLLLALAVIGLFIRPRLNTVLDRSTQVALLMATFAVGLVLIGGVRPVQALVLGGAAYVAQIVVALLLTLPRRWRGDRVGLALAQQNGMTAVVLALLLEPIFPGTIAIVAPAIVVVNLLHAGCNGVWNRLDRAGRRPDPIAPLKRPLAGAPALTCPWPVGSATARAERSG